MGEGVTGRLDTWEGVLSAPALDALIAGVHDGILIGQRAGDFTLGQSLPGGAAAWPSGRCFNEHLEIRWWPADDQRQRSVLVLNQLPDGQAAPEGLSPRSRPLAEPPEEVSYLCVGQHDERGPEGSPVWWETRYGRSFAYLRSAPPESKPTDEQRPDHPDRRGRVSLRAVVYELDDGRTQHRLVRFEHAPPEDAP